MELNNSSSPNPAFTRNLLFILPIGWLIINLLQACFTELANDEAYYWMYAKNLNVGYFDHPPMIAVMIKAGYFLFKNELGVRILTVILSALSIPLLYKLTGKKDFLLLFLLFCAIADFQVYGFIAVPDGPLMFFTILFFLLYREYLKEDKILNVLALGIGISLLLYSKYHGFLILFFTLISNFSLLKRKSFYFVVLIAVVLYLPHILWQIANDYPSYQYHVLNKAQYSYTPVTSLEYIVGQILVFGPLVGVILIYAVLKQKTKGEPVARAMKFTFIGFFFFFLLSTFNARAEANWTAASAVPMLLLGHMYITDKVQLRKWAIRLSVFSICLFMIFRINLVSDLFPAIGSKAFPEFYGWKSWAQIIDKKSAGAPVAIMNSYQKASKFSFYAKRDALSLNNTSYRRNQYDLWDIVDSMQGKKVLLVLGWEPGDPPKELFHFQTNKGTESGIFIDNFRSYTKINIITGVNWFHFKPATEVSIPVTITSPYKVPLRFDMDSLYPVTLCYRLNYYDKFYEEKALMDMKDIVLDGSMKTVLKIKTPAQEGPYYLRLSLRCGWLPPSINSRLMRMDIEK
ncbi:MAG TPA: glycosyltransferase family 39 protein [Bacteroidia bacterium]|nr:glycosyltransferase family 39 protein [Bacteroidia bacterium]